MSRTLVLVTSPPSAPEAQRALAVAQALRAAGHDAAVALLQDAVLAALHRTTAPAAEAVRALLAQEGQVYVATEDLTLRGFSVADLAPGAQALDDREMVELALADETRTLGAF